MENENKMTYEEFLKIHGERNQKWKYDLFAIKCRKCGSEQTEFNSEMELETCPYYGDSHVEGKIIIKCHGCGNAFTLDFWDLEK